MDEIKLFCPATIANVSCGFDVLGLCIDATGDEMVIRKTLQKGIRITRIEGARLPFKVEENVAGVAALALLKEINPSFGFEIDIYKKIKAGSGIGSSAASAAGAVFGINKLLGNPFSGHQLVAFAMQGEYLASGALHADNVAPALLGGATLIRSYNPLDIIKIPVPGQLYATVIHPGIEVKTAHARAVLNKNVPLDRVTRQCGNLGGLISGLYTGDYELIARSLEDFIAEPYRSALIPGFHKLKAACLDAGALGSGISGSGPSVFALSKGKETAGKIAEAMRNAYQDTGIDFDIHSSKINEEGIRIIH